MTVEKKTKSVWMAHGVEFEVEAEAVAYDTAAEHKERVIEFIHTDPRLKDMSARTHATVMGALLRYQQHLAVMALYQFTTDDEQ